MPRLLLWMLTGLLFACNPQNPPQTPSKPNIILIMTDDQGYGDLGITGNPVIETPNIDALARNSAWMNRFYVSPVCSPTRANLMTGRYNYRTRVIDTYVGRSMMEPEEVTIAEVLRDAGYATGIFGKWHLGDCYPMRAMDQGFEESLVHRGGGLAQPSEPLENNNRYTNPILWHNGEEVQTRGFCTDVYVDTALKFISRSKAENRPFFAYIPTNAPHGPFGDLPAELLKKYKNMDLMPVLEGYVKEPETQLEKTAAVYAMIENIDQNVGKLMAHLDKEGLTENTLVIFMVDNGPNGNRYTGPFRGMKSHVLEGGIRSPFFAYWPARLNAAVKSDVPVAHYDVMPSLLEVAGVDVPANLKLDGRSFLPLLEGKEIEWPDRNLYIQSHRGDQPVKLHHFAAIGPRYKLLRNSGFGKEHLDENPAPIQLFDIINDPGEELDLTDSLPEIAAEMQQTYENWFEDVSSTRPDNYAKPPIIIGSPQETVTVLTKQDWTRTSGSGWGNRGKWLLDVSEAGEYEVTVITNRFLHGIRTVLSIDNKEWEIKFPDTGNEAVFPPVHLEKGVNELSVLLIDWDLFHGPHQVIIQKI